MPEFNASAFWENLNEVNPDFTDAYESLDEFAEDLRVTADAIRLAHAEHRLAHVLGDVVVLSVDAEAAMANLDPHHFGTPDEADDENDNEEEGTERD